MSGAVTPPPPTASDIARCLRGAGVQVEADAVAVERRGDRMLARLPSRRIAWFATTPDAAARLAVEDEVLSLVGARCSFRVPAVLVAEADQPWGPKLSTTLAIAGKSAVALGAA